MSGDVTKCISCDIELGITSGVIHGECISCFSHRLGLIDASTLHQDIRIIYD